MTEQTIIYEGELSRTDLEPSDAFAGLVSRVGRRAGVGTLGLGAIEQLVRERASNNHQPPTPVGEQAVPGSSAAAG
jgi:hypothetical protein